MLEMPCAAPQSLEVPLGVTVGSEKLRTHVVVDSNYALRARIEEVHHLGADEAAGTGYEDIHDPLAFSATAQN